MRFADEQAFPLSEVLGDDEVEDVSAGLRLYEEWSFLFLDLPHFCKCSLFDFTSGYSDQHRDRVPLAGAIGISTCEIHLYMTSYLT